MTETKFKPTYGRKKKHVALNNPKVKWEGKFQVWLDPAVQQIAIGRLSLSSPVLAHRCVGLMPGEGSSPVVTSGCPQLSCTAGGSGK